MKYHYTTAGTCSRAIDFEIVDGKLHNVCFQGGCNGNLKGIGLLVEGADAADVARCLAGNSCGVKTTSCPDQLAKAITEALKAQAAGDAPFHSTDAQADKAATI